MCWSRQPRHLSKLKKMLTKITWRYKINTQPRPYMKPKRAKNVTSNKQMGCCFQMPTTWYTNRIINMKSTSSHQVVFGGKSVTKKVPHHQQHLWENLLMPYIQNKLISPMFNFRIVFKYPKLKCDSPHQKASLPFFGGRD